MGLSPAQIAAASKVQRDAAHATEPQVRLLAGPGTGKSASIEERVVWLLGQSIPADSIAAVSFTRASAAELGQRVAAHGAKSGFPDAAKVNVSTLHALALRVLKKAGQLSQYPTDPSVLDDWELENVFDPEFGEVPGTGTPTRREEIRRFHEAFWSTGVWTPSNYVPPKPPITKAEQSAFGAFLRQRGQLYSCVLPGELIRKCVDGANAGTLDLGALLGISHLIVDEFQDLNPCDLEFIDILAQSGVVLFAAGDDDQSIYAFRHAAPAGIQDFATKYPHAASRALQDCFRSTPTVLESAYAVLTAFPDPKRLPKAVSSLYAAASPPVPGVVHRWTFSGARMEARAVAESCLALNSAGLKYSDIMILLSSARGLAPIICEELEKAKVPFRHPKATSLSDTDPGRLGLALLRVIVNPKDLLGLRTLLGLRNGVGAGTCSKLGDLVITNNLSYHGVFVDPLPNGVFSGRVLKALNAARGTVATACQLAPSDLLGASRATISSLIRDALGASAESEWKAGTGALPDGMTLSELLQYLRLRSPDTRRDLLAGVSERLGIPPVALASDEAVQILTMHGAKGLAAQVVFIPGLEESYLPGAKRAAFPGLVLEAARLLFVSITRARASCIMSWSKRRFVSGKNQAQSASRFASHLGGAFLSRDAALTGPEAKALVGTVAAMK